MDKIQFKNVSLGFMIEYLAWAAIHGVEHYNFYWYHEDTGFHEIVECDLITGRITMDNDDFTEFEWEEEESSIYIKLQLIKERG